MLGMIWNAVIIDPMVNILLLIYWVLPGLLGFGVAIILFTILIRMVTYPLTIQQMKSTSVMQDMQKSPEFLEMQKKYKDDKQKLQQEQMRMYQERGVNPLGGCLPLLIQFPIIIGLYQAIIRVLGSSPMQLADLSRHVYSFIPIAKLVPVNSQFLWMDLNQPERLYIFGIGVPFLAILVVITTYMQSKLMTPTSQPGEQGAQMTQMMNLYMPFFMGYLALTFAAGLSLYFIASNVVTIAQYAIMGKVTWSNLLPKNLLPKFSLPKPAQEVKQVPSQTQSSKTQSSSKTKSQSATNKNIYPTKKKKSSAKK